VQRPPPAEKTLTAQKPPPGENLPAAVSERERLPAQPSDLAKQRQAEMSGILAQLDLLNERIGATDRGLRALTLASQTHVTKGDLEELRLAMDSAVPGRRSSDADVVYMSQLMRVASNFQNSLKVVGKDIDAIKDLIPTLVLRKDLDAFMDAVRIAIDSQQGRELESTAGGRISYKCLLCGRPSGAITGMITDSQVAQMVGEPPVSGPAQTGGDFVLVYGREGCFRAASAAQKKRPVSSLPRIAPT
jgi:hypothetical protein